MGENLIDIEMKTEFAFEDSFLMHTAGIAIMAYMDEELGEADPPDEEGDDESAIALDKDLPCLRCGYNLRGLKAGGQCPECGSQIRKSLDFAMERVLCTGCMRPNHPSLPRCQHCGAPLSGAASTSAYWQTAAIGVRKKPEHAREAEIEPPSATMTTLVWIFGFPVLLVLAAYLNESWDRDGFGPAAAAYGIFAAALLGFILLITWSYFRCYRAYQAQIGETTDDEDEDSTLSPAGEPEEDVEEENV